ncbi:MAG: hypothetical protein QOE33_3010 [Acidobacteriota bacterium]|nr:hypothetical protein [Acidobacteriota bacterium]
MKNLQRIALVLALLFTLTCGVIASTKVSASASRRIISGVVTRIDIRSRTIEVREFDSGRIVTVHVPEGTLLVTDSGWRSGKPLEWLLPGVVIRDVVVGQ